MLARLLIVTVAAAAAFYVKPHEAKMLLPKSLARNTKFFPCQVRQLFLVVFPLAPFLPQDTRGVGWSGALAINM